MGDQSGGEYENRDIKQAASVARMVELGKFPLEFTAYGCSFSQEGRQKYFLSAKAEAVYDFIYAGGNAPCCPTPCQSLSQFYLVPSGCREYFDQRIRLDLAQSLSQTYPEDFLAKLAQFAAACGHNLAEPVLSDLQERLWGKFQADDLQLFGGLVESARLRQSLSPDAYAAFKDWLEKSQRQLADDACAKDVFVKTLSGLIYYRPNGRRVTYFNADRATVYRRYEQAQIQGLLVSPLFQKTYWYNYQYRLYDVRQDFARYLNDCLDETYFHYLRALDSLPGAAAPAVYADFCQRMLKAYGPSVGPALAWQGAKWGLNTHAVK